MRAAFTDTLQKLAGRDKKVFLLTGDLGFSVLERFQEEFPDRYINMGVAEANMIGVAAGLALSGKIVFVYSIVPFATMRCFEQIRNDVCYQGVNVKIVGVGGGLCYGQAGPTHHSITDIAIMRSLPNMVVVCPGDHLEAELATEAALLHQGPVYLRLSRVRGLKVHSRKPDFKIGRAITLKEGSDLALISTGNMLETAVQVSKNLSDKGIRARVISMHTVKPLDKESVLKSAAKTRAVFTIEEHSLIGGLGGAVAEVLAESNGKTRFKRIALPDHFCKEVGSQGYLRKINSLSVDKVTKNILEEYRKI